MPPLVFFMIPHPTSDVFQIVQTPDPQFLAKMSRVLERVVQNEGWMFSVISDGELYDLRSEEVCHPEAFLPILLMQASQWMKQALGATAPMAFRVKDGTYCAAVPEPPPAGGSLALWLLFAHYTLEEWVKRHPAHVSKGEPIPLDAWVKDWEAALAQHTVLLLPRLEVLDVDPVSAPRPASAGAAMSQTW